VTRLERAWAGFLACIVLAGGCGYSSGLAVRGSGIQSVGVEFFGNETMERDLERSFHDELTRTLRTRSDAPLEPVARADAVVRGTIRQYHRRSGIRSPDNVQLETGIFLEVEAALHARGAEAPSRGPVRASIWVGFVIDSTGESERLARERAMRFVADELLLDLFAAVP
jgi:hypothetical protein